MDKGEGLGLRFGVATLIGGGGGGCTIKIVEMPISVSTGGRAEVITRASPVGVSHITTAMDQA